MVRNPPTREELLEEVARLRRTVSRLSGLSPVVPYLNDSPDERGAARPPHHFTPAEGLSLVDRVSRLYNREAFISIANQRLKAIRRRSIPTVLLTFRFENLADICSRLGEETGDDARRAAGVLLRETFRGSDLIGQVGEDLFAVLAVDATEDVTERIRERFREVLHGWNDSTTSSPYCLNLDMRTMSFFKDRHANAEELLADAAD